jgi:glyoxylase-like metal-dependent hydrolase (beta-lactamase superfamily II)
LERVKTISILLAICALLGSTALAQEAASERSIVHLAGDVYRFQAGEHFGVFMATAAGIIVVDPHDHDTAIWLRAQLASRFKAPVKYVIYSHFHYDHAAGAEVFRDSAVTVGQFNMQANLGPPPDDALLTGPEADSDANGDGRVQRNEAQEIVAEHFDTFDTDHDGVLNQREVFLGLYADVRAPDETFRERRTITLGGQSIQLIHVGGRHASDMTYIFFPAERILYVVDVISLKRLPVEVDIYDTRKDAFPLIDKALALNPTIVTPGHGVVGGKRELLEFRQYCLDLVAGVRAGIAAGRSLKEIQDTLLLEKYRDWSAYERWRKQNIVGIYYDLRNK